MQHSVHVTTSITTSPRNDSLLRASNHDSTIPTKCQKRDIDLPMTDRPQLPAKTIQLHSTTRPTTAARNDSTDLNFTQQPSSCIKRLHRLRLSATTIQLHPTTRPISAYPHQTSSCISMTQPTPATLVGRPAAHNHNLTIPAEGHIQLPWTFTYTFLIPAIKS